jgi:uncharacterized membrane-anchored protein YitT (DUF2179 family)
MIPRFDFTFSYWIFAWFVLYEFEITKYNPKFAILFALVLNIIQLLTRIFYKNSLIYIFLFVFANSFLKIIPLWILKKHKITYSDIMASIYLFAIYNIWLILNGTNIIKTSQELLKNIQENQPTSPFIYYVDKYLLG